jgi:hypothetical protein
MTPAERDALLTGLSALVHAIRRDGRQSGVGGPGCAVETAAVSQPGRGGGAGRRTGR